MKATFIIVITDQKRTQLMQDFDLFDKGRVITKTLAFDYKIKKNEIMDEKKVNSIITEQVKELTEIGKDVVFATLDSMLISHQPYFSTKVRQISDGTSWGMFHTLLKNKGYKVETTDDMYVKKVTI